MFIYLFPLFLYLLSFPLLKKSKQLFYIFILSIFALLPAFRQNIGGTDYFIYEQAYYNQDLKFEPLYNITSYIFYTLGFNFNGFLCIITLVCFIILIHSINKNSLFFYLAFFIYLGKLYIFYDFVILRQFLAMPFIWLSLSHLRDNQIKKFFQYWLIGFLFHYSAIFILPIYFLHNKKVSTRTMITTLILGVLMGVIFIRFLQILCEHIPYLSFRLNTYLEKNSGANLFNFVETILIMGSCLFYRNQLNSIYKHVDFYLNILWFSSLLLFVFSSLEDIKRVRDYFILSYFMILPLFPLIHKKTYIKICIYSIYIFYFTLLYIRSFLLFDTTTNIGKLIPYKTFLF